MAKVEVAPDLVRLGEDGSGREQFTTREMLDTERRMERAGEALADQERHGIAMASACHGKAEADRVGSCSSVCRQAVRPDRA